MAEQTDLPKYLHLQLLRGTSTVSQRYTGRIGELFFDKNTNHLRVHDGNTQGGHLIANFVDIPTKVSQLENDKLYSSGTSDGKANNAIRDQNGNVIDQYYSPLESPNFKGTPTTPTITNFNDNSSKTIVNAEFLGNCNYLVRTYGDQVINGTKTFNRTIQGTAYRALWGDLAELYKSDESYPKGTLICFGGSEEITIAKENVNGVISDKPAMLINGKEEGKNLLPVALCGRVQIRVMGEVKKFDKIVLSKMDGVGIADNSAKGDKVIGRALEDSLNGLVLCATRFTLD